MPIDDPRFLGCALAVFAGAFIQGAGGIGFAMFAAPIVALLRPDLVPGPMILLGGSVSLLAALREPRSVDVRGAALATAGRIPGSIVAGLVVGLLPRSTFAVIFAGFILVAVMLSFGRWRIAATPATLAGAGFWSGLMGTITSVGAPPIALVVQNMEPARLRATVGAILLMGAIVSLTVLTFAGRFGPHEAASGMLLLAPMALGFILSTPMVRRVKGRAVRLFVLITSAVSALLLLAQNI